MFVFVVDLRASPCRAGVGMGVRVSIDRTIGEGSAPGPMIDQDGVSAPDEACAAPAKAGECRSDGDDGAEADSTADEEARARSEEDDGRAIDGDVVEEGIDGLDLEVAAVVDDVVVRVGGEVAVVPGLLAHTLDGVHDIGPLAEYCIAEGAGPLRTPCHRVEHRGEGK